MAVMENDLGSDLAHRGGTFSYKTRNEVNAVDTSEWVCRWCSGRTSTPMDGQVICVSRVCQCGAIALAAPAHDFDEVVDDAIHLFGIADEYLTPFDWDRVAGLEQLGVNMLEGSVISGQPSGSPHDLRVFWFRKDARH